MGLNPGITFTVQITLDIPPGLPRRCPWRHEYPRCGAGSAGCHCDISLFSVDNETDMECQEEEHDAVTVLRFTPMDSSSLLKALKLGWLLNFKTTGAACNLRGGKG
jgi:hypothetical protein